MQNNMVSIPSANMNGGLKAANSSGTVVGVGVGVAGTVLTNAQRVYLTPASSFHLAARQTSVSGSSVTGVGMVGTAKVGSNSSSSGISIGGGSSLSSFAAASTSAAGTVRYFSQFSKLQPVQQQQPQQQQQSQQLQQNTSVGQRKLLNGDTMVLVNGNKPLIFATPVNNNKLLTTTTAAVAAAAAATTTTTTTVPNGNRVLINKQQQQLQLQQKQQQPDIVIDELELHGQHLENDSEDVIEIKQEERQQQQQNEPLALLSAVKSAADQDAEPELDIVINNVVCSFSVRCHLKLREIALNGSNVEYRRENGMVTMKLRRPYTTASIWSSGRITCTGATSEVQAKIAARRYARCLSKLGFPTHFQNFRIVNVLGTCSMPWAIKIVNFSERHRENASYEPELHPGVTYKMREPKATLKIFSTGSITVTAASVNDVESAIQHIYPLVHEFRKQRSAEELQHLRQKQRNQGVGEPSELEDQLATEAKTAARDNMFVNTTAAHTNAIRPPEAGANILTPASVYTMRRLEQYKSYQQMQEQTQTERRHVTFTGYAAGQSIKDSTTTTTTTTSSSSSTSDNICANARRRATECWATKLQNKRPRYNDPGATGTGPAGSVAGSTAGSVARTPNTNPIIGGGVAGVVGVVGVVGVTGGAVAGNKLRSKPPVPDLVLTQSSSRLRGAVAATLPTATINAGGMYTKRETYSPTDFQVDDLIEEDDVDDMDMHF